MKSSKALICICIALTSINIAITVFYIWQNIQESKKEHFSTYINYDPTLSDVIVPDSISLAGEKVPLQRRDVLEALKKELIVNTYLHSHTIQILKTAPRVFSIIEPILKKNGIPDDFKYLAVIESRLDPQTVSPAGATGVWQFMKNTAKEYGLEVDNDIDERYHIEKSTEAACAYLKKSYEKFGSWTLAAASYNAGSAMLTRQMNIQKENYYYNLLLGEETERYVFRILALKQIINNPELYNFKVEQIYTPEEVETVVIKGPVKDWAEFAQKHGITYKTLKRFNPWLRKTDLRNARHKTYEIKIPVDKELYR